MKIAFFTEGNYIGKVPRTHPNMRTDLAWIHLLDADHYPYKIDPKTIPIKYDIGICIIPKAVTNIDLSLYRYSCRRIGIMQEGPADYWTDYTLHDQLNYLKILSDADFIFCHNAIDVCYYEGLVSKSKLVQTMPSVMVEPNTDGWTLPEFRQGVIIGGNMCSWYNGMVSFLMAKKYSNTIYAPSMGRKIPGEDRIEGLKHLPYLQWNDWMKALNDFKLGIHLMPTVAAGTFSLNCAFLGIPCIGNRLVDTQDNCFNSLSVDIQDLNAVAYLIDLLKDAKVYNDISESARTCYNEVYRSDIWVKSMDLKLQNILD